jgi:hypothetical protein
LFDINAVRMYLQVTTMPDIADANLRRSVPGPEIV